LLSDDRITTEIYDLTRDSTRAAALHVDKAPAVVVLDGDRGTDHGVRFFGIPSGYEFASLISAVLMVSSGQAGLTPTTIAALSGVAAPLHIQVFVTPTCPYCPAAVTLAHKLAMASPHVSAEMIDASEFPDLSDRFGIRAVPHTVINGKVHVEGSMPEAAMMEHLSPWTARQP
jgi:glutaredoxin-like protein